MTFDLNLFTPLLAGLIIITVMVLGDLYLDHKYGQEEDKRSRSPKLTDPARPEIIEEFNKLSSAKLTLEQINQLIGYTFIGKTISKELRNIAKLPDTVYKLNYAECYMLMDIVSDIQEEYEVDKFLELNKKYKETGFIGYKILADFLKKNNVSKFLEEEN